MADGRRTRWFASDAYFFDGTLGVMIRERFGSDGLVLWFGWLGACKRSSIPGQIQYGSVPDALAIMGLPGLRMVDDSGVAWDLQSYWRALAAHKQCSTSTRGRLTQVRCSNWSKWQQHYGSAKAAEQKATSRATNTPDSTATESADTATIAGHYPDDTKTEIPSRGDLDLDLDLDLDQDIDQPPPPPLAASNGTRPPRRAVVPSGEDSTIDDACRLVAERQLRAQPSGKVGNPKAWIASIAAGVKTDHAQDLHRWLRDGESAETMADRIDPAAQIPGSAKLYVPPPPPTAADREASRAALAAAKAATNGAWTNTAKAVEATS